MKTTSALFTALCLLALAAPAGAHPGHESPAQGYLVFWKGILPQSGPVLGVAKTSPEIWSMAFISKFPILGARLPQIIP